MSFSASWPWSCTSELRVMGLSMLLRLLAGYSDFNDRLWLSCEVRGPRSLKNFLIFLSSARAGQESAAAETWPGPSYSRVVRGDMTSRRVAVGLDRWKSGRGGLT